MQNEKWYVIVNPAAGNGAGARHWHKIEPLLREAMPNSIFVLTQKRDHARELAAEAIRQGYRQLLGVGGDGTNNEIINGIFAQKEVPVNEVIYTLLPVGTGNDWVRTHGIPRKIDAWLRMLAAGKTMLHDVGLAHFMKDKTQHERYFVNVAGMAYDAFVVEYAERYKKWIIHKLLYLLMVVRCLFLYRLPKAKVIFDNKTDEDFYYTINIGISKYSGGGMQLVPHANPTDGLLALTLARKVTKLGVLLNTYRFYNGTLHRHPKIDIFQAKTIRVEPIDFIQLELDGELVGEAPASFSILGKALRIIVP